MCSHEQGLEQCFIQLKTCNYHASTNGQHTSVYENTTIAFKFYHSIYNTTTCTHTHTQTHPYSSTITKRDIFLPSGSLP